MAIPTIAQTITRGDISTYLIGNANAKGVLFGGKIAAPGSMVSIAMVTDALRWGYDSGNGGQTDESLRSTANYLIWLCGQYGMEAQAISQGAGGGTVVPGGNTSLAPLDWIVGASSSSAAPLAENDRIVTFDGTGGMVDLRGYNITFARGGLVQYTTDPGDGNSYYSWIKSTGLFTLYGALPTNGAAQLGEPMRIEAYI